MLINSEFLSKRIKKITDSCTHCGKCFEVCPIVPYTSIKGMNSELITKDVIGILKDENFSQNSEVWVNSCEKSGICIDACPEDINPREMLTYAKLKLQSDSEDLDKIQKKSRSYFRLLSNTIKFVSAFQMPPDSYQRLISVKVNKKKKSKNVFYFGCNILQTPHILFSCIEIFDRLGIDYEIAGGVSHCCGINHMRRGDLQTGVRMGANSLEHFLAYEPERIITFCPTCQMQYTEYSDLYSEELEVLNNSRKSVFHERENPKIPFVHITKFLIDNFHQLSSLFVKPVKKRVGIHLHSGVEEIEKNVQKIVSSVPGIELVEIKQRRDHSYQCPSLVIPEAKEAMRHQLFNSAREANIDSLVTVYHSCHRDLCGEQKNHPFEIINFTSLLGEAMSFEYSDILKNFKIEEDWDLVLKQAKDSLLEYGFHKEDIEKLLLSALDR
tara:strand:- start:776 stop:2095 length:1320 start_codon:yes stop_codon:yes gene_type:complete